MIWKHDHAEPLTEAEYLYWMTHPLPFGWAILSREPMTCATVGLGGGDSATQCF